MAHPLWPIYDLRLRTDRPELRLPTKDEIANLRAETNKHKKKKKKITINYT